MVVDERRASGATAGALRSEARILERCRHPGVIELLAFVDTGGVVELRTGRPDGRVPAERSLEALEASALMAALTTTVADLHDIGVAHGSLTRAAISIDAQGRPTLGDFSKAAWVSASRQRANDPGIRADDVALGRLLADVLIEDGAAADGDAREVRRLGAMAAAGRLTARELADALGDCGCRTFGEPEHDDDVPGHRGMPWRAAAVLVSTTVLTALITATMTSRPKAAPDPDSRRPPVTQTPCTSDDCRPLAYAGDVLTFDGRPYAVGMPGDQVTTGHWACSATPLLALLRPSTGVVWVFRRWPAVAGSAPPQQVGVVAGATSIATDGHGPCDLIVVTRGDGSIVTINPTNEQ